MVDADGVGFAGLVCCAVACEFVVEPGFGESDGLGVFWRDAGVEEVLVVGGFVEPDAVFCDARDDEVGGEAAHGLGEGLGTSGAEGEDGAVEVCDGRGVVLGDGGEG